MEGETPLTPFSYRDMLSQKRVVIQVDGGRIRTREKKRFRNKKTGLYGFETPWREPKEFCIYVIDDEGKIDRSFKPIYEGTIGTAEEVLYMNYKEMTRKKLPCGSGYVESQIRRVLNLRLKSPGMFWKKENVEVLLMLRNYLKAGRWDALFRCVWTDA